MTFAIVIPCYNRTHSLKRLLFSLNSAVYSQSVDLIFSIDYSGKNEVLKIAQDFVWNFGNKKIISHRYNIGLKANILSCGDLTSEYDAVILLEDDLVVSPAFFEYASKAADYYQNYEVIAGISLYSYEVSEIGHFTFYPVLDKYDTYYIQWPSSWGQLWTRNQWNNFKEWLNKDINISTINIPDEVKSWTNSWKKYFIAYMVACNKFFVYPYRSFSNEIGKGGIHHITDDPIYTVNLFQGSSVNMIFRPIENKATRYDCFFQPLDNFIIIDDKKYEVTYNLYGTKKLYNIGKEYVITPQKLKKGSQIIKSYSKTLKPYDLNIIKDLPGNFFHLVNKTSIKDKTISPQLKLMLNIRLSTKNMVAYVIEKIINKLINRRPKL